MQYKKKPVIVEAHQFNGEGRVLSAWMHEHGFDDYFYSPDGCLNIKTLEGNMKVSPGDWVIRGTRGEFYPCKPGPFADTFEEVEAPDGT